MEQANKSLIPLTAKELAVAFKLDFLAGERFCFILGSGASRNSGIKTGKEMIGEWREELLKNYGDDKTAIRRAAEQLHYAPNEWEPIFEDGYEPDSRHYFVMYDLMYARTVRAGYDFMEKAMASAKPSIGYYCLASILSSMKNRSNLVITTNFDTLTEDALFFYSGKHPLVLGHERMASFLRSDTDRPIVAKIHRDMLLEPMSRQEEMRKLKEEWSKALRNVLPNCIPIVIGYAGGDNTLMDLLKDESLKCRKLYWCSHVSQKELDDDAAAVIANHSGEWVQIPGFDELLFQMANNLELVPSVEELKASTEASIRQYEDTYDRFIAPFLIPVTISKGALPIEKAKDTAQAVIREETRRNPEKISEWQLVTEAWRLWNEDQKEEAITKLTDRIRSNPNSKYSLHHRSVMYRKIGCYTEALQDIDKAINLDSGDARFYAHKAATLRDMGKLNEAEDAVEKAIELDNAYAYCHGVRSGILLRLGRIEEADEVADRAIQLDPTHTMGQFAKSEVLYEKKQYAQAQVHIEKALNRRPNDIQYLKHLKKIQNAIKTE